MPSPRPARPWHGEQWMSKRCWPRAITAASTRIGNSVASSPLTFPVYISSSSFRWPRATVPSTSGRAERASLKKADSRSGMYFGWSCMSWRHAEPDKPAISHENAKTRNQILFVLSCFRGDPITRGSVCNGRDLPRVQRFEEVARRFDVELGILRLDAEEEPVTAGQREPRQVEDRVIRHRQAVEREHAEDARQRGRENRALEGDRDERRPAVQRLAADVERVRDDRRPVLQRVAADAADQAANQHDERQTRVVRAERVVQFLDRERLVRVHAPVAFLVRALRRRHQRRGILELGHQAVDHGRLHSSPTLAPGRIVRISKIEIIGRKRRNRNSSDRNRPIVPRNVDQSQNVGAYRPHDEGRKSRCKLSTMITNRSSHMPTFTTSAMMNRLGMLVRICLNHSSCGMTTLQRISAQ